PPGRAANSSGRLAETPQERGLDMPDVHDHPSKHQRTCLPPQCWSRSAASSTNAVAQLVERPGDEGDRTRIEAHDGGHGHQRIRQVADYAGVTLTLFDV